MYAVNDFGLHNQGKLNDFLVQGDLVATLLDLKMHWYVFEMEDQLVNLLENLISLIGYDRVAVKTIIRNQIKQVILIDHCDTRALEILKRNTKDLSMVNKIDIHLHKIMTQLPTLINNPLFVSVV